MTKYVLLSEFMSLLNDKSYKGWVKFYGRKLYITQGTGVSRDNKLYMKRYRAINKAKINSKRRKRYKMLSMMKVSEMGLNGGKKSK